MKLNHLAAIPLIATSIVLLAGCGHPAPAQSETTAQIWHELVACARSHGYPNLPDPTIDSQGLPHLPPGTDVPKQAPAACQSIFNRLPASIRNRGGSPPDIAMEIRFAQCMRAQGLTDWPDPNANGDYPLPPDLRTDTKSGPLWDRIRTAWDACRSFNPAGHISVTNG